MDSDEYEVIDDNQTVYGQTAQFLYPTVELTTSLGKKLILS